MDGSVWACSDALPAPHPAASKLTAKKAPAAAMRDNEAEATFVSGACAAGGNGQSPLRTAKDIKI